MKNIFTSVKDMFARTARGFLEKFDLRATYREIKEVARAHGWRFGAAAAAWEVLESVVIPAVLCSRHQYLLAAFFVVFHFEPIVWPIFFFLFRTYDRICGRIPWDPPRLNASTSWRSATKVCVYRAATILLFWLAMERLHLGQGLLALYTGVMTLFGFAHERLWNDSGWGITAQDQVLGRRVAAKTLSYRAASLLVMALALRGLLGQVPWMPLALYQGAALGTHLLLEVLWARSTWGIRATSRSG